MMCDVCDVCDVCVYVCVYVCVCVMHVCDMCVCAYVCACHYEPAQGLVQSPTAFAKGLAKVCCGVWWCVWCVCVCVCVRACDMCVCVREKR